jgi:flagellar basal-body rod modification protein FlgD
MSSIANTYAASTYSTSGTGSTSGSQESSGTTPQTLGQDDFLKLLIVQLRNQNPLEPMSNTDFIAQTAQFSSLQQLQNLNSSLGQLYEAAVGVGELSAWWMQNLNSSFDQLYAANLLGRTVEATDPDTNQNYSGQVTGYSIQDGQILLAVDGAQIEPSWITSVSTSSS